MTPVCFGFVVLILGVDKGEVVEWLVPLMT